MTNRAMRKIIKEAKWLTEKLDKAKKGDFNDPNIAYKWGMSDGINTVITLLTVSMKPKKKKGKNK